MQATPNLDFWQWFQELHPDHRINLVGLAILLLVIITVVVCVLINVIHRRRAEMELKRELLDRGMSAEEIATVIAATPAKGKISCGPDPKK